MPSGPSVRACRSWCSLEHEASSVTGTQTPCCIPIHLQRLIVFLNWSVKVGCPTIVFKYKLIHHKILALICPIEEEFLN